MRRWATFFTTAAGLLLLGSAIPSRAASPNIASDAIHNVPVEIDRGYLILAPVTCSAFTNLTFIVDTGADRTVIGERLAGDLRLLTRPAVVGLVNRNAVAKLGMLSDFELGPIHVSDVEVFVKDLSALSRSLQKNVDGIVGMDVLRKSSFEIDYQTRQIRFGGVRRLRHATTFDFGQALVAVDLRVRSKPLRMVIDTGSSALVIFANRAEDVALRRSSTPRSAANLAGDYMREPALIGDLILAGDDLGSQTAFLVSNHNNVTDFDGLLGPPVLGFRQVAFDFEHHIFSWTR